MLLFEARIKISIQYVGILVGIDEPYALRDKFLFTCNTICIEKTYFIKSFSPYLLSALYQISG
jgi:hypothetical protein